MGIHRVLVANRGEIALRVMKTAKKMNIETVAVYSDADRYSQHTLNADLAYRIGEASPLKSYLCGEKIVETALKAGAQAIHPGYGFLSENATFAQSCADAGLTFIGPPPSAIRDMGMKNKAKRIMIDAGVSVIEGYNGTEQSTEVLYEQANKIGFPVMIKAVYGGGGKGMRIARSAVEFKEALESAKTESMKAFGNSEMIIERFVENPRHVEVQMFGDSHGNYVYLWERDCSIQRRHQKIIEEAPAPGLSISESKRIGEAGANAGRAVGYTGAGTVEFILDSKTKEFYFMEMNTRLQVEHPVTEAITGLDLVEWQFIVANGGKLPLQQDQIPKIGHSMETRVYAEDSANGFMPAAGRIEYLSLPEGVRVDSGVVEGDDVSVHYDPMIAKVIVHGTDRSEAIQKLDAALAITRVGGLPNNIDFVRRCLNHPKFVSGDVYTEFIKDHEDELLPISRKSNSEEGIIEGICSHLLLKTQRLNGPFGTPNFFRVNHNAIFEVELAPNIMSKVTVLHADDANLQRVLVGDTDVLISKIQRSITGITHRPVVEFVLEVSGKRWAVKSVQLPDALDVDGIEKNEWKCLGDAEFTENVLGEAELQTRSPMPGIVDKVLVNAGEVVEAGQTLIVMIAMKMEYVLKAPINCRIDAVLCSPGKNVKKDAVLVKVSKVDA